jgi:hypothetical protein
MERCSSPCQLLNTQVTGVKNNVAICNPRQTDRICIQAEMLHVLKRSGHSKNSNPRNSVIPAIIQTLRVILKCKIQICDCSDVKLRCLWLSAILILRADESPRICGPVRFEPLRIYIFNGVAMSEHFLFKIFVHIHRSRALFSSHFDEFFRSNRFISSIFDCPSTVKAKLVHRFKQVRFGFNFI